MPSFLQQYQDGRREEVWRELVQLGGAVRQPEHFEDARVVARETMRRARQNVETLIGRLHQLGYQFQTSEMDRFESHSKGNQALQFADGVMGAFSQQPGAAAANPHIGNLLSMMERLTGRMKQREAPPPPKPVTDPLNHPDIWTRPAKDAARRLDRFEKEISGPLPLSLRAWCEEVGSVSFIGSHPVLGVREGTVDQPTRMYFAGANDPTLKPMMAPFLAAANRANIEVVGQIPAPDAGGDGGNSIAYADPLVVQPCFDEWDGEFAEGDLILAPDADHKANTSGGDPYGMQVPNPAADGVFLDGNNLHFVEYLRKAFRCGGFPGFARRKKRPEKELAYLAEGLLEI